MEIQYTKIFEKWLSKVNDHIALRAILARLRLIKSKGHLGEHKSLGDNLFELRFHLKGGYRLYYTIQRDVLMILLVGGKKQDQQRDIEKARYLLEDMKNER